MKKRTASVFLAACLISPLVSCRGENPEPERESSGRFRGTEVALPDSFEVGHDPISLSGGILRVGGWFVGDYNYTDAVLRFCPTAASWKAPTTATASQANFLSKTDI